jgi:hypothetical protein
MERGKRVRRAAGLGLGALVVALAFAVPAAAMPGAILNFPGMGHTTTPAVVTGTPPSPSGAAGPNAYVQMVNGGIEVFSKTGTVIQAAKSSNTVWSGYPTADGNHCAASNSGDGIVRYDQLANRWIVTQFDITNISTDTGPSFECVAVSKTGDPTGAYWLYDFPYNAAVNDYPKIGVWPDAYYATYNLYNTSAFIGVEVCAWNRAAMLAGQAAGQQCFTLPAGYFSLLPANVDGSVPPPAGSPEYLMGLDPNSTSQLDFWTLHIDWAIPSNSVLSTPTAIPVMAFTEPCSGIPNCIPQGSSTVTLDALGDRLMDRLAYRNFGDHQSLVVNHTVVAGTTTGIRWYELGLTGNTPSLTQQGTYAPSGSNWRWMGSIAQDQAGDMTLGFSTSSTVSHPAIAWTGRLTADAPGTMGQGEATTSSGTANETAVLPNRGRWGDYTSMTVDPSDDCTFWYTNEVYNTAGTNTWDTRIASVKFAGCAANDFSISATPTVSAAQSSSGSSTIATAVTNGSAGAVALNASGVPAGASAALSPSSLTAGQSSTLTLTAGPTTVPGTYTVSVVGTGASAYHGTSLQFTVLATPRTLSVTKSAAGIGTVSSSPAGIDCGSACSAQFTSGTPVTLTAAPATGSVFLGWAGSGCSGTGTCQLTMDSDKPVTANFDRAPTCSDLSTLGTASGSPLAVALACSDPDSADTLHYTVVSGPSHGQLSTPDSTGHLTYTPAFGYTGTDSFTFQATDNHGVASAPATATITVGPVVAPTCAGTSASVAHDRAKAITLPCSHTAADALRYAVLRGPAHGLLGAITAGGQVTYTPKRGYGGVDAFTYTATDTTTGMRSNVASVAITVALACAGLRGEKLAICKAALTRTSALQRCSRLKGKQKRKSCSDAAKRAYRRAVALAHCPTLKGHRQQATCIARARKLK